MTDQKAVPVLLRQRGGVEVLAFVHPAHGRQLIVGSMAEGESAAAAGLRELFGVSGVEGARISGEFGAEPIGGSTWHFLRAATPELPEDWVHATAGGQTHAFFWQPLDAVDEEEWHPDFVSALAAIRRYVA
jgi:hypothetical protein